LRSLIELPITTAAATPLRHPVSRSLTRSAKRMLAVARVAPWWGRRVPLRQGLASLASPGRLSALRQFPRPSPPQQAAAMGQVAVAAAVVLAG